ncbi:H/ACA ribonucleoprotein complex non-core subunit NAF1 [Triplophysa tibetana]|uniref:H/ACA ribonucleoprotein complex non-core subunit NAF1 n=1 Tax=Triplophysa tibetana TaxID=1572043 RepID=A0A5A9PGL3_9TELE|nr:H/ACA ribonucleoprotein complex non-core subunit NAF1 [Triplophysa tibetana]
MEVDDETPHSQSEPTGNVNLQSPVIQSMPGEPCTISQSEPNVDQCTDIKSEQTGEHSVSSLSELKENQCTNIVSEHRDPHSACSQSEPKEDHCTNIESEQTSDHQPGHTEIQHISMHNEQTGDVCTSSHSGPREDHLIRNTSGPPEMKSEPVVSPQTGTGSLALLSMQYRGNGSDDDRSDSDSDSSSSTSSSSSSTSTSSSEPLKVHQGEDDDDEGVAMGSRKKPVPVKTQDELLLKDLPEVENLTISLPDNTEMEPIGTISSIVEQLVIVEAYKNTPPLNEDSVLFSQNRNSVGKVFEVFGPVCQPYYVMRFNSNEDISKKELKIRDPVYFAPKIKDFTGYIFTEKLKDIKGSDASWKNDQEPPAEALDYSDDEKEKMAKQKLKYQKRRQNDSGTDDESDKVRPAQKPTRRKPRQNRNAPRGQHHNPGGGFHSNHHAHPPFPPPDYIFPPSNPHMFPYQGPMYPPFPRPPPFHMGMPPWPPGANQGFMFHPPPPPPPPPSNQ